MGRKRRTKGAPAAGPRELPSGSTKANALQLVVCLAVSLALIVTVWAVVRRTGDLYVGYAGGRDVLAGKIGFGQKDDWCFNTTDEVWFNQNWGTHLLYHLTWVHGGEMGYLVLKMAFLLLAAGAMAFGARQRGAAWPVGILVAGSILVSGHAYIDLRPNLTTLTFAPVMLCLLLATRGRPHRIWWAVGFLVLWANMHGGFMLGLGMIGLWAACNGVEAMIREGVRPALRRLWPLLAGAVAAMALSATVTPFGHHNLTHPFVVQNVEIWREVQEWHSVWKHDTPYGTTKEFFIILGILAALLAVRMLLWEQKKRPRRDEHRTRPLVGPVVFDVILALVVLRMGFNARRFVPLATITIAPMLAGQLDWFLGRIRRRWFVMVLAGAMAFVVLWPWRFPLKSYNKSLLYTLVRIYHPDNPAHTVHTDSVYEIMISDDAYCHEAVQFIKDNGISGRVVQGWRWEGFLHWHCPDQLKLFVGGRAQQVHPVEDYKLSRRFRGGPNTVRLLDDLGAEFVIVPIHQYAGILRSLHQGVVPRWVPIFCDGINIILADSRRDNPRKFIRAAENGTLRYPSPWIRAWSDAERLCWPYFDVRPRKRRGVEVLKPAAAPTASEGLRIIKALAAANALRPTPLGYARIHNLVMGARIPFDLVGYLARERQRLARMKADKNEYIRLIPCREFISVRLWQLYMSQGKISAAAREKKLVTDLREQSKATRDRWR